MNMKTLSESCRDAALEDPASGAAALELETDVTEAHRRHAEAHPAIREAACLHVLFPRILQPIEDADLFAGRIRYPLVSFSPEPMGVGYSCQADLIEALSARHASDGALQARAAALLGYWRGRTTAERVRAAYPPALAAALPSDAWMTGRGIAFPLCRIAGTVLDYGKLLALGLPGLCAAVTVRRASADAEGAAYLEATLDALNVLADSLRHYAAQAAALAADCPDAGRAAELRAIAANCRLLVEAAPQTLAQAIQLTWLYALHSGTWNYGRADVYLGPFLSRDLAAGRLEEAAAQLLLESWWRLMKAYDNQFNNRVIIGGLGRPDAAVADRFARIAIAASRASRLNQPQLTLRFHGGQDSSLMKAALDALAEGVTFPMLYNDDVNVPAVAAAFGVREEEAVHYVPYGCGEYVLEHRSVGSPNGVINLAKAVELALHDGCEPLTGRRTGPPTGALDQLRTFDDLWRAYTTQVEAALAALAEQERLEYDVAGRDASFLFASALTDDCLARARPLLAGGVRHLGGTIETYGNVNAADSLTALNEVVYQTHRASLPDVVAACAANFAGPAPERLRRLLQTVPKYGNDQADADAMAVRLHEHVCGFARAQAARVGLASYLVVIINNWANVTFGANTGATPDGRKDGEPLANGNNPAPGADRHGATAFLNSLVKLSPAVHAGAVQNMKFSREFFTRHREKLEALLAGYWRQGGTQAMINVVSQDDLRAAMAAPENWGHLMVRVGGFSARFVDLPPGAQREILARTCHE